MSQARFASTLLILAMPASATVITQDGVVFTSISTGKVLTLEIDAARRSGGWTAATAIDWLAIKTMALLTAGLIMLAVARRRRK